MFVYFTFILSKWHLDIEVVLVYVLNMCEHEIVLQELGKDSLQLKQKRSWELKQIM